MRAWVLFTMRLPVVGISTDVAVVDGRERAVCGLAYADAVWRAGGTPILLVPHPECLLEQLRLCDAVVLTGGDDPRMEAFGVATHPKATPVHPRRQDFETRVLDLLSDDPRPTLGVCLGMQMMALHAGGTLDQHLPDTRSDAARHWGAEHAIEPKGGRSCAAGLLVAGVVHSRHRQAVSDPGPRLEVLATSDDGVIEAISDPSRPFHVGVQWHPERTSNPRLGLDLFRALVHACAGR